MDLEQISDILLLILCALLLCAWEKFVCGTRDECEGGRQVHRETGQKETGFLRIWISFSVFEVVAMATFRSCIFKLAHCGSSVSQLRGEQLPTTPALAAADQHSTCRLRGVRRISCPIEIPTPLKNQSGAQILGRNYHHHPLGFSARFDGMKTRGGGRVFDSHPSTSSSEEEQEEEEEEVLVEGSIPVPSEENIRNRVMEEVMQRMTDVDLKEAAQKYDLEEELFAEIDYAQIDAFTDHAFGGNSAAVCYLPYEKNDKWLQLIAREFNLSETAFLVKRQNTTTRSKDAQKGRLLEVDDESGKTLKDVQQQKKGIAVEEENEFDLRWFTPTVEVDLCGHATLASAHLLFASGIVLGDTVLFHTKSGVLKATKVSGYEEYEELPEEEVEELGKRPERRRPGGKGVVQLDFPLVPAVPCNDTFLLSEALGGVAVKWAGETSLGDYLVELPSSADVERVKPQFHKMMNFHGRGGVIITALAPEDSEYDFVSRFFCPKGGISEDPATGSAHCTLGPYWASKLGKKELKAFQASERGAKILVQVDEDAGRVYLQGGAVLVMAGVLLNTMAS